MVGGGRRRGIFVEMGEGGGGGIGVVGLMSDVKTCMRRGRGETGRESVRDSKRDRLEAAIESKVGGTKRNKGQPKSPSLALCMSTRER